MLSAVTLWHHLSLTYSFTTFSLFLFPITNTHTLLLLALSLTLSLSLLPSPSFPLSPTPSLSLYTLPLRFPHIYTLLSTNPRQTLTCCTLSSRHGRLQTLHGTAPGSLQAAQTRAKWTPRDSRFSRRVGHRNVTVQDQRKKAIHDCNRCILLKNLHAATCACMLNCSVTWQTRFKVKGQRTCQRGAPYTANLPATPTFIVGGGWGEKVYVLTSDHVHARDEHEQPVYSRGQRKRAGTRIIRYFYSGASMCMARATPHLSRLSCNGYFVAFIFEYWGEY